MSMWASKIRRSGGPRSVIRAFRRDRRLQTMGGNSSLIGSGGSTGELTDGTGDSARTGATVSVGSGMGVSGGVAVSGVGGRISSNW